MAVKSAFPQLATRDIYFVFWLYYYTGHGIQLPFSVCFQNTNRKWQDYVYIQCEYKSTKQKIKHLLREENKVKENKIS